MARITSPLWFGLKNLISKPAIGNLRVKPHLTLTQKSLSTTCACKVKQITVNEVDDKIVIEGKVVPSPREKYLAKLPTNPTGCKECPLCRLGLTVRHTDVLIISQFVNSKGKQLPREVTGLCREKHKRMDYLIVMAEKAGLIDREVERKVVHNGLTYYEPEEWDEPHFHKYYDETVIDEFLYSRRKRH
ncbi:unnamed protein product [Orchesella dallaii]|uniref:28S ribosomal protein S18a, mitochondrial n=1 Tax=Orchesella dallaii TaxID=48710 RepID=A0ABP1QY71_9HEXA